MTVEGLLQGPHNVLLISNSHPVTVLLLYLQSHQYHRARDLDGSLFEILDVTTTHLHHRLLWVCQATTNPNEKPAHRLPAAADNNDQGYLRPMEIHKAHYLPLKLEKAGVRVYYSFPGLKVHAKLALVRRIEDEKTQLYAYLATGNFHEDTAKIYSDFSMFTVDPRLTGEVSQVFRSVENMELPSNGRN